MDLEQPNDEWNDNEFIPEPVDPNQAFEPARRDVTESDNDDLPF